MSQKALVLMFVCGALLSTTFLPGSATAQSLCSGRCLYNYYTLQPYCSMSLFGTVICHEGFDYCVEFACPEWGMTKQSEVPVAGECKQAAPVVVAGIPEDQIKVVAHKDRS